MPKYINNDETIKAVREQYLACDTDTDYNRGIQQGFDFAMSVIRRQPTADVVEVVRCKDCKHLFEINKDTLYVCDRIDTGMDGEPNFLKPEIDFCSYGERKEAERKQDE